MRILQHKKNALKLLKKKKNHTSELSLLLGLIFVSFIIPSSVALFSDSQNVQVSNTNEYLDILQKSQSASYSQQWSQGTLVSGCINPGDFWGFLWNIFNHLKPETDFTANATNILPGETVEFKYKGGRNGWYKSYLWDFGDGGTSKERNPNHTYNNSGIYDVSLTTIYFWIFEDTLLKEDYIEVYKTQNLLPEADFEVNNVSPLTNDLLQFTYTGTEGDGIESFYWDFGDGIGFSEEKDPEYSYSNSGLYDVSLYVIDIDGDENTEVKIEYITVIEDLIPLADFEADIIEFLEGGIVQFTYTGSEGNGIYSYNWNFGDGGTSSEENPSYQYLIPGLFTVSLTVVDTDSDEDTAVKEDLISVIEDLEPIADFTADAIQVIQNGFIDFTYTGSEGNGIESYSWNFGDGGTSEERDPVHQFLEARLFTVSLTVIDTDGDESTVTKVDYITVDDELLPIADFTSDFQTVISDDIIQFTFTGEEGNGPATFWWDFGDGSTSEERDPIYQYFDQGFYTISLTVVDIDNDESTETKFDYIEVLEDLFPFTHFFANLTEAYTGDLIQFSFLGEEGNGPAEYFYEFGDGSTSTEQNPTHSYSEAGLYSIILTVTDIDGDIDVLEIINYITIEENIIPIADFSADFTDVVLKQIISFTFIGEAGNSPTEFYWDFGDGTTSSEKNPSHIYGESGKYNVSLTITDSNGEKDTVIKEEYITVEEQFPIIIAMGGAVGAIALISTGVFVSKRRALS